MGLKKFWKWMTGRLKKENAWLEAPRIVPDEFSKTKPGDDLFSMSQEYARENNPSERRYFGLVQSGETKWTLVQYDMDLEHAPDRVYSRHPIDTFNNPMDAVVAISAAEATLRNNEEWVKLKQSPATFRLFAARHGIHFEADGTPFAIEKESALKKEVFLTHQTLVDLFNNKTKDTPDPKDWAGLHAYLEAKMPELETVLPRDEEAWQDFSARAGSVLTQLDVMGAYLHDPSVSVKQKLSYVQDLSDLRLSASVDETAEDDEDTVAAKAAWSQVSEYLFDAALVLGMLRGANDLCRRQFSQSLSVDEDTERVMKELARVTKRMARSRLGATEYDADKIPRIIGQGPDPQTGTVTLRSVLQWEPVVSTAAIEAAAAKAAALEEKARLLEEQKLIEAQKEAQKLLDAQKENAVQSSPASSDVGGGVEEPPVDDTTAVKKHPGILPPTPMM